MNATEKQIALIEKLDIEVAEMIETIQSMIDNGPRTRFTAAQAPRLIEELRGDDEMSRNIRKNNPSQHITLTIRALRNARSSVEANS